MSEFDSLPKRVGVLEQENHLLKHRVAKLEETPPRVQTLEHSFGILDASFARMRDDLVEIKADFHDGMKSLTEVTRSNSERTQSIFTVFAVVVALIGAAIGGVKLYDSALSIQQKRHALEQTQAKAQEPGARS